MLLLQHNFCNFCVVCICLHHGFQKIPKKNKLRVNIEIIAKPIPHLNRKKKIKTEKLNSNLNIKLLEISVFYTV